MCLEISQNSQENTCARVSILLKLQAWCLQLYEKRDSGTGIFLCILRNFWEHFFNRTPLTAASVNISKEMHSCRLTMVEGLFSFLFYCASAINQYAVQKTLIYDFRASLLLLEVGCLRYVVLPYYLRMLLRVFMKR